MREKVSAADHQRRRSDSALDHAVGDRHAVNEPAHTACRSKAAPLVIAERGWTDVAGGGKSLIGSRGRQHDQVEFGRLHAGMGERALRGLDGEMRGELAVGRDVALA
jgi:hypothetical protein